MFDSEAVIPTIKDVGTVIITVGGATITVKSY